MLNVWKRFASLSLNYTTDCTEALVLKCWRFGIDIMMLSDKPRLIRYNCLLKIPFLSKSTAWILFYTLLFIFEPIWTWRKIISGLKNKYFVIGLLMRGHIVIFCCLIFHRLQTHFRLHSCLDVHSYYGSHFIVYLFIICVH